MYRFDCKRQGTFGKAGNEGITVVVRLLLAGAGRAKLMLLLFELKMKK